MNGDLISRSAALEKLTERAHKNYMDEWVELTINEDIHAIKGIPAVDAVEVVRCGDCRFWIGDPTRCYMARCACYIFGELSKPELSEFYRPRDGFCNYGQRRVDNEA